MRSKASVRTKNAVINHHVSEYHCKWIRFDDNGDLRKDQWELVTLEHLKMVLEEGKVVPGLGKKGMEELKCILAEEEKHAAASKNQNLYYTLKLPVNFDPALFHRLVFLRKSQYIYYFTDKEIYYQVVDYLVNQGLSLTITKVKPTPDINPSDIIRKNATIFRAEKNERPLVGPSTYPMRVMILSARWPQWG